MRQKKKKAALLLIFAAWSFSCTCNAAGDLPAESQRLIDLLQKYEQREQKKLDAQITKKRNEVLILLRKHLKQRTQNGQLDKGIAIRKEILKLEALITSKLPNRLSPTGVVFFKNGKSTKVTAASYIIDSDGGKLELHFKHEDLGQLLNTFKKAHLEIVVSKNQYADTKDSVLLRYENKTLANKKGLKQGETVKLAFDHWKITRIKDTLVLGLENSGSDGFVILGGDGKTAPTLVFSN